MYVILFIQLTKKRYYIIISFGINNADYKFQSFKYSSPLFCIDFSREPAITYWGSFWVYGFFEGNYLKLQHSAFDSPRVQIIIYNPQSTILSEP